MQVRNTEQLTEDFIEEHGVRGEPHRCVNTSKVWGGHAFETKLTREGTEEYEFLYSFAGPGVYSQTLSSALWFCIDEAEHGGYLESFDRWRQEYDYDYAFDQDFQKLWYEACVEMYTKLRKILGADLYAQLAEIIQG